MKTPQYIPVPDVVVTQLVDEGEILLMNLQTTRFCTLNETGAQIWNGLNAGQSRAEIAAALTESFDVDREEAEREVAAFLGALLREGLVEEAG